MSSKGVSNLTVYNLSPIQHLKSGHLTMNSSWKFLSQKNHIYKPIFFNTEKNVVFIYKTLQKCLLKIILNVCAKWTDYMHQMDVTIRLGWKRIWLVLLLLINIKTINIELQQSTSCQAN